MGLVELLSCVGNDNIEFQKLGDCLTSVKEKRRDKCTELSFLTQEITPTEVVMGTGKIGIVVWVDREIMAKAYDEAAELAISSYDANQDLINKQAEQLKMLRDALNSLTQDYDSEEIAHHFGIDHDTAYKAAMALIATKPVDE